MFKTETLIHYLLIRYFEYGLDFKKLDGQECQTCHSILITQLESGCKFESWKSKVFRISDFFTGFDLFVCEFDLISTLDFFLDKIWICTNLCWIAKFLDPFNSFTWWVRQWSLYDLKVQKIG